MEKKLLLLLLICAQISLAFEPWNKKQYIDCVDSSKQYILAADVSMVNTTVGLFEVMGQVPTLIIEYSAKTSEIKSLSQAVQTIVRTLEQNYHVVPQVISIASPGAVDVAEKTIQHPHLPWVLANSNDAKGIDAKAIQCATGISNILLINDFQAGAYGIQHAAITTKTLQAGQAQETGTKAVVGAGNGLGVGVLIWDEATQMHQPHPLNYSFTEFGAHNSLELKYYDFLEKNIGINAYGKVLGASGGIIEMYNFLDQQLRYEIDPYVEYKNYEDIFANRHKSLRCKDAVDFFMKQYIRLIRNVMYAQNAVGGIYITNTVAEKNPELFENKDFLNELVDFNPSVSNGHTKYLKNYLAKIPVYLVHRNENMQLYGAALYALKQKKCL